MELDAARVALTTDERGHAHVLGRGAFGVVYAGVVDGVYPVALKQLRALKGRQRAASSAHADGERLLLSRSARQREAARRQLERETRQYRRLARVGSVATFYGVVKVGGATPLLVVERLACSVADALQQRLDAHDVLLLGASAAAALAELHAAGAAHGDIKPSNLLLTRALRDGRVQSGTRVKLVDLGLSRCRSDDARDDARDDDDEDAAVRSAPSAPDARVVSSVAGSLAARGTPRYLSPEAWGSSRAMRCDVAQMADVYALAMVLFQMDCGVAPWRALHQWHVFAAVCVNAQRPQWPSAARMPQLRALVETAWQQDALLRPTAAQLAASLARLRDKHAAAAAAAAAVDDARSTLSSPRSVLRQVALLPQPDMAPENPVPLAPREGARATVTPRAAQYAFRQHVLADDPRALCDAIVVHEREPPLAAAAMEALAVLLDDSNLPNCRFVAARAVLQPVSSVLARFGRADKRLCKAACVLVLRLAHVCDAEVDKHLRSAGACEMVLHCARWHPASLPVVLNAVCALAKLAVVSSQQACIVVEVGGVTLALRAMARSCTTFGNDLPVATAAFDVLHALSASHAATLLDAGVIHAVADCCDRFQNADVDAHAVRLLYVLVASHDGKNNAVATPRCLDALSRLIDRYVQRAVSTTTTLNYALHVVSEMARSQHRHAAATVFMSTSIVSSVIESKDTIVSQSNNGNLTLIHACFECLSNMSTLGTDVCGSLQMSHVFSFTNDLVRFAETDATVALKAVLFVKSIMHELRNSSYAANLELVHVMLSRMYDRWKMQPAIAPHVRDAMGALEQTQAMQRKASDPRTRALQTANTSASGSRQGHGGSHSVWGKLFSRHT